MTSTEQLEKWIRELPREKLEKIAYEVIDRLIDTDEIRYHLEDESGWDAPYWISDGVELGENE